MLVSHNPTRQQGKGMPTRAPCLWADEEVDFGNAWAKPQNLLQRHASHKACRACMWLYINYPVMRWWPCDLLAWLPWW